MNKQDKMYFRVTKEEKEKIKLAAENHGFKSTSKYLLSIALDSSNKKQRSKNIVYDIALSPTLDYVIEVDANIIDGNNTFDKSNRKFFAGGRGVNTSKILNEFNIKNKLIHHSSGFAGHKIQSILNSQGIEQVVIKSSNETRVNVNVVFEKSNYAFSENVEQIDQRAKDELLEFAENNFIKNDTAVISGSFKVEDSDFIVDFIKELKKQNVIVYLNSSNANIDYVAEKSKPHFVILCQVNNPTTKTKIQIQEYMEKFIDYGVNEVVYVVDANYSFYASKEEMYMVTTENEKQTSFIGQEDAYIAGFIANNKKDTKTKLTWAAASLKAKSLETTTTKYKKIYNYYDEVEIKEI